MFEHVRHLLLRLLRVPPEPDPPFGNPGSVRVFRASRKLYWLRLIGWSAAQVGAAVAIALWLVLLFTAEQQARSAQTDPRVRRRAAAPMRSPRNRPFMQVVQDAAVRVPSWVFALLWLGKGAGVLIYLGQLATTYTLVRLDYEMRWYMVTDRSLRIRNGLWKVEEMTMSFANLQQVVVSQGPLQRLLGISDLQVQSAGGGDAGGKHQSQGNTMHTGIFRGVENAVEIRDLILERLRHFRETGLGDPDEHRHAHEFASNLPEGDAVLAARELLEETRRLRQVLTPPLDRS